MKVILLLLLSAVGALAQAPLKATNLWLTTPPVQSTAGSIARFLTFSTAGVGETVTPTKLWDAVVLTGTPDSADLADSTTIGRSMFSLTNPSAITFPRFNADNTVTARNAVGLKTDLSLENVNNTSDLNKPVSTAAQAALDLKANIANPTFTVSLTSPAVNTTLLDLDGVFEHQGFVVHPVSMVTIPSDTTITPLERFVMVSGTSVVSTITVPSVAVGGCTQITIIPTGVFTTNTSGNIALASTAVVSRALIMTYDAGTGKWYPSY